MMMAIVLLLLTVIGAGVGFAIGVVINGQDRSLSSPSSEEDHSKDQDEEQPTPSTKDHSTTTGETEEEQAATEGVDEEPPLSTLHVIPFPPILTTLAEPKGKWIRLEGALLALQDTELAPDLLAEQTGEQILTYLRTVRLADIETSSGFLGLRDDLNETVRVMSHGQVRGVLIHGLVVE